MEEKCLMPARMGNEIRDDMSNLWLSSLAVQQCSVPAQASNSLYDPDAKRREEELEKRQKEEEARKFRTQMEFAR